MAQERVEEWRQIPGAPYEVSSIGGVRRTSRGGNVPAGRALKPAKASTGYLIVGLHAGGMRKNAYVHRLVAAAFIGPCPVGHVVNHIDANRLNNERENLEYVTPRGNAEHASRLGRLATGPRNGSVLHPESRERGSDHWSHRMPERCARGDRNGSRLHPDRLQRGEERPAAKLTAAIVMEARRRAATGESQSSLAREYGVSTPCMRYAINRQTWRHIP